MSLEYVKNNACDFAVILLECKRHKLERSRIWVLILSIRRDMQKVQMKLVYCNMKKEIKLWITTIL